MSSPPRVTLAPGAQFAQTVLTSGARRQRIETRVRHPGAHAEVRLDSAYLLDGQRHADLTSVVTHGGLDGVTRQLTKGMVTDQARGVFQGRIVVEKGADQTDARMGHHALILSDKAEIDAKPELLMIFADDVSCAHGNTIGALDDEVLFYAKQRGIPGSGRQGHADGGLRRSEPAATTPDPGTGTGRGPDRGQRRGRQRPSSARVWRSSPGYLDEAVFRRLRARAVRRPGFAMERFAADFPALAADATCP